MAAAAPCRDRRRHVAAAMVAVALAGVIAPAAAARVAVDPVDVRISPTLAPTSYALGTVYTVSATVTVSGAPDVVATIDFPLGFEIVEGGFTEKSLASQLGSCDFSSSRLTCRVNAAFGDPPLPLGQTGIRVEVKATKAGASGSLTFGVSTSAPDPDPSNNQVAVAISATGGKPKPGANPCARVANPRDPRGKKIVLQCQKQLAKHRKLCEARHKGNQPRIAACVKTFRFDRNKR